MSCPQCAKHSVIAIDVTVGEHHLRMHSCSTCENRWWEDEGHRTGLPRVLELAATRR